MPSSAQIHKGDIGLRFFDALLQNLSYPKNWQLN